MADIPPAAPKARRVTQPVRSGTQIYSEALREERLYNQNDNTPALSSYFELMDRLVPNFLSALSSQKIRGTRVLLN